MKKFLLPIIFIILTTALLINYENIFRNKDHIYNIKQYYNEKTDIDVFFLGTSRIYYSMSPMEIWDKYGITSYNRGTPVQTLPVTYLFLKEIFLNHSPKLVIIDTTALNYLKRDTTYRTKVAISNIDNFLFKLYAFKYVYGFNNDFFNNLNTINTYHYRWKELHKYDFINETYWKGRFAGAYINDSKWDKIHSIYPQKMYQNDNITSSQLDAEIIKYTDMIIQLAQDHNTSLLFIKPPNPTNDKELAMNKSFGDYLKQNKINFIDYNTIYNEIILDFNNDFKDNAHHLNLYGARKVMDHLIPYIIEHYNIPNRKNDPNYASWNEDYIKYARAINREEIRELTSFVDWKKQAFYDNYTVMISTHGDVLKKLPDTLKNDLKSFGLNKYNTDKANMRYAAIIDDNKVFFEEISNKPVTYKGRMKNIVNLLVSSDGKATISVSGKPRSKNKYGLNFVIYDKVNREIVDSIWIDPNKPDEVRR